MKLFNIFKKEKKVQRVKVQSLDKKELVNVVGGASTTTANPTIKIEVGAAGY